MIRINLLPVRAAQKKEKLRAQLSILILCILLAAVGCGALYIQKNRAIRNVKDEIATINEKNRQLSKQIGQVRDFEKRKAELEKKLAVLQTLKENKSGPVHLLDELSSALPDKLWLTKFSERNGSIDLSGIADSENTVADFMERLDASSYYQGIDLQVTQQSNVRDQKMQSFNLKGRVERPTAKN